MLSAYELKGQRQRSKLKTSVRSEELSRQLPHILKKVRHLPNQRNKTAGVHAAAVAARVVAARSRRLGPPHTKPAVVEDAVV